MTAPTLRTLPTPWRVLFATFLLATLFGYLHALIFVEHTTRLSTAGIAERYVGSEALHGDLDTLAPDAELQYEKSLPEMLNLIHTHVLAMAMLFLLTGSIFLLAEGLPSWLRNMLLIEPFAGLVLTFGGMWLTRYVDPAWSILVAISGTVMTLAYVGMVVVSLAQLLWKRK